MARWLRGTSASPVGTVPASATVSTQATGAIASDEPLPIEPLPDPERLPVEPLPELELLPPEEALAPLDPSGAVTLPVEPLPEPELLPPEEALAPLDPSGAVTLLPAQPRATTRSARGSSLRRIIDIYRSKKLADRNTARSGRDQGSTCATGGGAISLPHASAAAPHANMAIP